MNLSQLAKEQGFSDEFCDFLAKFMITGLFVRIDDNCEDSNALSAINRKFSESSIMKIFLGIAEENKEDSLDAPSGMPEEFIKIYEEDQKRKADEREKDPLKYYERKGTAEYMKHCNKDGSFRYSDFIPAIAS